MKKTLIVIILMIMTSMTAQALFVDEDVLGYWKFEEESYNGTPGEVKDNSTYSINGKAIAGANTTSAGKIGRGLQLDGLDDYVNMTTGEFNLTDQGSFVMWTREMANFSQWSIPVSNGKEGWPDFGIAQNVDDGWAMFAIKNSTGHQHFNGYYGDPLYQVDEWVFIAGTYNGTTTTLYISNTTSNTLYSQEASFSGDLLGDPESNLKFGLVNESLPPLWNGTIDEVILFKKSLNLSEIEFLYNNGTGNTIIPPCINNWTLDTNTCLINNTILITYTDQNNCQENGTTPVPGDNGTYGACNYCTEDITFTLGICQSNDTQTINYTDQNQTTCCDITGLGSDCSILFSPFNTTGTQACNYLTQNFTCTLDTNPVIEKRIPITCTLPNDNYECLVTVQEDLSSNLLQSNPEYQNPGLSVLNLFPKETDTRETFSVTNTLMNGYYTDQYLRTKNNVIVTALCSDGNNTLLSQTTVTPEYEGLDWTVNRMEWAKQNTSFIIIFLIILAIIATILGYLYLKVTGRR